MREIFGKAITRGVLLLIIMTSYTTALMGNVVHWVGNPPANFEVSTSIPCPESNHFYHPTTTTMVQATSIFSLDHWSNLKMLPALSHHHQNPSSSQQPEWSVKGMDQITTDLWVSAAHRLKSKLPTTAHKALWNLIPTYLFPCFPCSSHSRHTGFLTIRWTYQLLFYLKNLY